ncbi:hypothetical protein [Sodalis sp. dw_96]|uniref:hypothetical protein n=1 Tax=Sodalis sp. dw_96 TaxID=2719794 RepID=UPI001BD62406|nr:hypothetical protein [Sodalis sp. dw_96]
MSNDLIKIKIDLLTDWFKTQEQCTIATSGGIDSMLLAYLASDTLGSDALIAHSASASVPSADASRVNDYARKYRWNLKIIESNEINNLDYKKNPVNRCYYCKSCLFDKLTKLDFGRIVTGTNSDDLGDYRPGLIAARENNVLQPYVELQINKSMIRQMASSLLLDDLKDIPASPCLSSRIETGIEIKPNYLHLVDQVEIFVKRALKTDVVRFRIRHHRNEIELSQAASLSLDDEQKSSLLKEVKKMITPLLAANPIEITTYRQGSAFIGVKNIEI